MGTKKDKILYLLSVKKFLNLSEICKHCNISRQALYYAFNGLDYSISSDKLDEIIEFIKNL